MRRIVSDLDTLGECPTWDDRAGRLVWIDVTGKRISCCGPEGEDLRRQGLPEMPGCFVLREGGGRVIAFRHRIAWFREDGSEEHSAVPGDADMERERFNDGACDRRGRLWVGTMDRKLKATIGALYRVDPDRTMTKVDSGFGLSNGIAWSPDDTRLYHCDSRPARVFVHDFDLETGALENRREFTSFDHAWGEPDGCAVDQAGFLWIAAPRAQAVFRFDPDGRLERKVGTHEPAQQLQLRRSRQSHPVHHLADPTRADGRTGGLRRGVRRDGRHAGRAPLPLRGLRRPCL